MLVGDVYFSAQDEAFEIYDRCSCYFSSANTCRFPALQIEDDGFMENKKQIVTLTDIKEYYLKGHHQTLITLPCLFVLFCWLFFITKAPIIKIIMIIFCLLTLWGIADLIYTKIRIQNNTYFEVRTDILINKKIQSHIMQENGTSYRLCFCKGHYEMYMHGMHSFDGYDGVWYDIYDMGSKTVYDTAFIGDSFTLICVGKRIYLAFNNNYFDIQNDL